MAANISFSQGAVCLPKRCPVTGATEGLVEYTVYSWVFAVLFTLRSPIRIWFTEQGYQQHLQAIGTVRRIVYGIFTICLYIPLFGRLFAAMLTVYIGWILLLARAIKGPPGLATYKTLAGIFSNSDNVLHVQDHDWAKEFCQLNPGLKPVITVG
jgi:drug/metabolite transporter superfamily protein YnfA